MCTVLLPPGGYPIAVNKYIYLYVWDSKGVAARILNPGFKWRQVVSSIPRPFHPPGKESLVVTGLKTGRSSEPA